MQCKVYQIINGNESNNSSRFRALQKFYHTHTVDPSIYQKVLELEVEEQEGYEIAIKFYEEGHLLLRENIFAISDVLVTEKGTYLHDEDGLKMVTFDESLAKPMKDSIRILYVEPMKRPYVAEISKDYRMQQQAVQGLIEYIYNSDQTIFVVNDEHKINGMQGNRRLQGDVIAGPFFVAGDTREDLCSLTDEQLEYYKERFWEPEEISQEEIQSYILYQVRFEQSM